MAVGAPEVVVPDRQLSLAIGKEGQNARLAAKLTGWRIDIKSQTAYEEELAAQGITPEQAAATAREDAQKRAKDAAARIADEAREAAAAAQRPLTPEEEVALEYAEREAQAPVAEASAAAAATVAEPVPASSTPSGPAKPMIRFAEELVRPPLEDLRAPAKKKGGGPPGRKRSDEEEAARLAALNKKKKGGGGRRILPDDEDEDEDGELDLGFESADEYVNPIG